MKDSTAETPRKVHFTYYQHLETAMPGFEILVGFSADAQIAGDDVTIIPGSLVVLVEGGHWERKQLPTEKTPDGSKFLALLRNAARKADWESQQENQIRELTHEQMMGRPEKPFVE